MQYLISFSSTWNNNTSFTQHVLSLYPVFIIWIIKLSIWGWYLLRLNPVGLIKPILAANMVNNNESESSCLTYTQPKLINGNVNLVQTSGTSE